MYFDLLKNLYRHFTVWMFELIIKNISWDSLEKCQNVKHLQRYKNRNFFQFIPFMIKPSISITDCHEPRLPWIQSNESMTNGNVVIALQCVTSTCAIMIGAQFPVYHQWNNEMYRFGSNGNVQQILHAGLAVSARRTTHSNTWSNIFAASVSPKTPTIDEHISLSVVLEFSRFGLHSIGSLGVSIRSKINKWVFRHKKTFAFILIESRFEAALNTATRPIFLIPDLINKSWKIKIPPQIVDKIIENALQNKRTATYFNKFNLRLFQVTFRERTGCKFNRHRWSSIESRLFGVQLWLDRYEMLQMNRQIEIERRPQEIVADALIATQTMIKWKCQDIFRFVCGIELHWRPKRSQLMAIQSNPEWTRRHHINRLCYCNQMGIVAAHRLVN